MNAPGSMHGSMIVITEEFIETFKNVFETTGGKVIVDSAFITCSTFFSPLFYNYI
jgi:hypothetical protein